MEFLDCLIVFTAIADYQKAKNVGDSEKVGMCLHVHSLCISVHSLWFTGK